MDTEQTIDPTRTASTANMVWYYEAAGTLRHCLERGLPVPFGFRGQRPTGCGSRTDGVLEVWPPTLPADEARAWVQAWAEHIGAAVTEEPWPDGKIYVSACALHWSTVVEAWALIEDGA